MNQNLFEKLKKLLSMAKNGTQHEAEVALAKAQQIAIDNGIDLAVVAVQEDKSPKLEMVEEEVEHGKRLPIFSRYAHWILQSHFNVKILLSGSRYSGRSVCILGDKADVEFAKYVKSFLEEDMQRRWIYYYKSNNVELRMKHTWADGVYNGLDMKLQAAKEESVQGKIESIPEEVRATVENKYALIVQDKKAQVEEFLKKKYPKLGSSGFSSNVWTGSSVHSDGFATGQTMNIHRPIAGQSTLK